MQAMVEMLLLLLLTSNARRHSSLVLGCLVRVEHELLLRDVLTSQQTAPQLISNISVHILALGATARLHTRRRSRTRSLLLRGDQRSAVQRRAVQ